MPTTAYVPKQVAYASLLEVTSCISLFISKKLGSDVEGQQNSTVDFRRDSSATGAYRTSWTTTDGSQILSSPSREPGEFTSGCDSGRSMEVGFEPSDTGHRAPPAPVEVVRQWHHPIGTPEGPVGELAAFASRQCNLPTLVEATTSIMAARLLLAQVWNCTMNSTFNTAIWGPWEPQLLSMLVSHAGEVVNPCDDCFLGRLLADWFDTHSFSDQHDAGEFAGWFRQRLLEKTLPHYMQAEWSARLTHSIEDKATVFAPVPLACAAEGSVTLQQLILTWHQQESFVHAFTCDSPWICLQISRCPTIGTKSHCSVEWDRRVPLQVPVFRANQGLQVEWHDFVVTAGITHKGEAPTQGHYQSGTALECDDHRSTMPLGCDPMLARSIYLLWIVPNLTWRDHFESLRRV